jgi:prevent-host-death family protein
MAKRRPAKSAVGAAEFKARCLELVEHVKEARAEYTITRHGKPVARLVPVDAPAPASRLGSMRGTLLRYDRPFDPVPGRWSLDQDEPE